MRRQVDWSRVDAGSGALWASAAVLAGLVIVQAGRLGSGGEALAGNTTDIGQVRLLTADAGGGEEVLVIVNNTDETISVYSIQQGRSIELHQMARLNELFEQARGRATGGRR